MRNLVIKEALNVTGEGIGENLRVAWEQVRNPAVVPVLQVAVYLCIAMSLLLSIDRLYMTVVFMYVKLMRKKRYSLYNLERVKEEVEVNKSHPKVLVKVHAHVGVYVPSIIGILNALCTSSKILFENVMSMRARATITGLFKTNLVYDWIVREKLGSTTGKQ